MTQNRSNRHNHSHASHHGKRKLARWQKNAIHFGIILVIAASLVLEGAKLADVAFLALSVVTEFS